MDCIECKRANPEGNCYCGQCGAELGRSLVETVKKRDIRDREAVEIQIAESVGSRLIKWGTVVVVLFGLLLGKSWFDVRTSGQEAKAEIEAAFQDVKKDIASAGLAVSELRQRATSMKEDYTKLQTDIGRYKQVNQHIEELQKELKTVQGEVVDLGKRGLRAASFTGTGPGPFLLAVQRTGCPRSLSNVDKVAYCAEGSPLSLFQVSPTGDKRPVSSLSSVGFQDTSTEARPTCSTARRGTFYVEKATKNIADKPFLCAQKSDNTYAWIQLVTVP